MDCAAQSHVVSFGETATSPESPFSARQKTRVLARAEAVMRGLSYCGQVRNVRRQELKARPFGLPGLSQLRICTNVRQIQRAKHLASHERGGRAPGARQASPRKDLDPRPQVRADHRAVLQARLRS
jgi:hypothetical protein